jgi:hypothetical protein
LTSLKESGFFFAKKKQKLLLIWAMGCGVTTGHDPALKSLFASFSSEKEVLTYSTAPGT